MGEVINGIAAFDRAMTAGERMARQRQIAKAQGVKLRTDAMTPTRRELSKAWKRTRRWAKAHDAPFMGVDGEGAGTDAEGRQQYRLLRAGEQELYTGQPLSTAECLDFILSLPRDVYLVGFGFGYDVTMICRDLNSNRRAELLRTTDESKKRKSIYTYWSWKGKKYGLEYLPKNYFRVSRFERDTAGRLKPVPGSVRTIDDCFGCFQGSFLKTLTDYGIAREHWPQIRRNKAARGDFMEITDEIRRYNEIECFALAELMETFRRHCHAGGIRPRSWNGAGKLAAALHEAHGTLKREAVDMLPSGLLAMAQGSYYGGRFEITRTGAIAGPVYEYDIRSAYPAAMRGLPCLEHGRWERQTGAELDALCDDPAAIYAASVWFLHPGKDRPLCGLPIRQKTGRLMWPKLGGGIYWSEEIASARAIGAQIKHRAGWKFVRQCECDTFPWVSKLFDHRQTLPYGQGLPLKLGINSLYGKLVQRIGKSKWRNLIWGGMITARVRTTLNRAIGQAPEAIVMLATDALYSLAPLDLAVGKGLGEFEAAVHDRMFVVQPGVYWTADPLLYGPPAHAAKYKSRGFSISVLQGAAAEFEQAWQCYIEADQAAYRGDQAAPLPPHVTLQLQLFMGLKLSQARGKPELAGRWIGREVDGRVVDGAARRISFNWTDKRAGKVWETRQCVRHGSQDGGVRLVSMAYDAEGQLAEVWDMERLTLDEQPDYVETVPDWII